MCAPMCNRAPCSFRVILRHHTAICDYYVNLGFGIINLHIFHLSHNIHALDDASKYNVLAIEMRSVLSRDEKLGAIGSRPRIGHRQQAGAGVLHLKVFVGKLLSVNTFSSHPIPHGKVATLDHEIFYDSMESTTLVVQWLPGLARPLLPGAQCSEVLSSLGRNILVQLHDDSPQILLAVPDIKEHVGIVTLCVWYDDVVILVTVH
mmetsp:Transcript_39472/g.72816  ORF Transcript_39472/g.72816 Transcript_39472/m.72816 type:complete len:205 (+) Transcript_39472:55-669(+)